MEIYSTEEQQVEAIKRWWSDHGNQVIIGIVIGLGSIWGWRAWTDHKLGQRETASAAFEQATASIAAGGDETAADEARAFIAQYGESGYAGLAALLAARDAVQQDDLDTARSLLEEARSRFGDPAIEPLVRQRLIRVLLAQEAVDEALALALEPVGEAWQGRYAELQGDVYLAKGMRDEAREAYRSAVETGSPNPVLQMKFDDLAAN